MKYFLIGIDGVSMKGIAKYLESQGDVVVGSDIKRVGHSAENITDDIDIVVRTSAINPGSPGWVEVEGATKKNIKVLKRSEFIGQIFKDKKMIAVSGMHGKTTITSMISLVMEKAGLDPTCLVGDEVREWGDVVRVGKSDWFVFEACEYDKSILDFYPTILILTNVEEEHLDSYPGGLPEIMETFQKYIDRVPEDGLIVANASDANIKILLDKTSSKAKQIMYGKDSEKFNKLDFELSIPGLHNIENALAVAALCDYLKIDQNIAREVLTNFHGAHRRFEKLGQYNGADIIDDYGHHPTEIKATLEGLKQKYPDKKRIVVFWPHQYKRIKSLLSDFGNCFNDATELILKPIFFVPGRDEMLDVKSEDIMMLTEKNGVETKVFETDEEILEYLKEKVDANSVVLTLGIPPVYKLAKCWQRRIMDEMEIKILEYFGDRVKEREPLKDKVSLKVGGVADFYLEVETIRDLSDAVKFACQNHIPYFVLGGGYNILPSDSGFAGLVIKNKTGEAIFSASSSEVIVESGISVGRLINLAAGRDLGGLEFMFGIPGTIGGAIYGNAGAFGHEIGDFVKSVTLLIPEGDGAVIEKVSREWFGFDYRSSKLKRNYKDGVAKPVILTATLQLARRRKDEILKMMKESIDKKKKSQPLDEKSAGSYFKNPGQTKEMAAGYLIEKSGGKKMKVGDAGVSSKHANFLINRNNASSADIKTLAQKIKDAVSDKFNVVLEEEIEYIGN